MTTTPSGCGTPTPGSSGRSWRGEPEARWPTHRMDEPSPVAEGCGTRKPESSGLPSKEPPRVPWPSLPTDGSTPVAPARSVCGTWRPGSFGPSSKARETGVLSFQWPSPPTARSWPAATPTAPSCCGTCRRTSPPDRRRSALRRRCRPRPALLASYPNPFNQETWIPFQLDAPARVRLSIHDVRGALVREIDLGHRSAGWYRTTGRAARWDGRGQRGEPLASGVYFVRLQGGAAVHMRKMLLLK